ncbi:MAG: DNA polymerase III subunit delta [Treponema sp.]|nr:DNA polymerase III subunit delta [Treponema sp.]
MSAYIFLGPELGKKQDAVNNIKEKFPGADEIVFYAGETNSGAIADAMQNRNLFADAQIVIVKNADLIKKKDEIDLLVSCINNTKNSDNAVLILLSDELKLAAALDNAVPKASRQVFYELFEREKNEWLREFFRREGFIIDRDCTSTILEMVENNTEALRRECSRLVQFLRRSENLPQENGHQTGSKNRPVKTEDIEKWLSHNREESAFTLFSRIASGDLCKALESLSVMLAAKESAPGILAGLAWCFRKLGDYIALLEKGEPGYPELAKIGLSSPKVKSDYVEAARRYKTQSVEACLALTAEYDLLLRSPVAVMEKILMDKYILAVFKAGAS